MYCSSCGTALSPQMKYCNRCGAQQTAGTAEQKSPEDQLRSVGVDLFWGMIIGLGLILGGMVVLRKVLHLRDAILVFWMILSTAALGVSVALDLFQIQRILRKLKRERTRAGGGKRSERVERDRRHDSSPGTGSKR
jgi:hypothetical protein